MMRDEHRGACLDKGSKPLALLVEDDSSLRAILVDVLHDSGVEVLECESAEAALAHTLTRGRELIDHIRCLATPPKRAIAGDPGGASANESLRRTSGRSPSNLRLAGSSADA